MSQKLARRFTVTEVVRVYNEACDRIRGGYAMLAGAEQLLNETFTLDGHGHIRAACSLDRVDFGDPEATLVAIRQEVWRYVIERLEVRRMMSVKAWTELQRQIKHHELPELTEQSVTALVARLQANLSVMLADAVEEVFDWLRPPRSAYKRNSEYEVPRRIVIRFAVDVWSKHWRGWYVNHDRDANFTALENVFSALDGRGQITKTLYSAITTAIRAPGFDGAGETPYFQFRVFRNGNMHLTFRRLDLLARFNAIAGGRRLRAAG